MFNVDGIAGQNREMTREALEIILSLWTDEEPFEHKGKYWNGVDGPSRCSAATQRSQPFQKPHPPIGVAGLIAPRPRWRWPARGASSR